MVEIKAFLDVVRKTREDEKPRNFSQSFELILTLKNMGMKMQDFSLNEVIVLPNSPSEVASICVIAGGDLALRARRAGADMVVEPGDLDRLTTHKREAKKLTKGYSFFLGEVSLMPRIGRILGPYLGPKGKMPPPLPPNAPVEEMIGRMKTSVRARSRGQFALACRIGDEKMADDKVAENALTVYSALEGRLPQGENNIANVMLKKSMGKPVRLSKRGK